MLIRSLNEDLFFDPTSVSADQAVGISPHNFVETIDDFHFIAFNSLTNAIDICNANVANILNGTSSCPEDGRLKDLLYARGYITDTSTRNLLETWKTKKFQDASVPLACMIALIPTYSCNARCNYCYEHNLQSNEWTTASKRKAKEFIKNKFSNFSHKECVLALFGGEPLLLQNKNFVKWAFEVARQENVNVIINTNGIEVSEFLDVLTVNANRISSVALTLDGVGENHDRLRKYDFSKGSPFERIIKGIKFTLALGIPVHAEINLNRQNSTGFVNLLTFIRDIGWFENPLFSFGIGRVDDRLFTGKMEDMLSEVETLKAVHNALLSMSNIPDKLRAKFLKSTYYLAKAFGLDYNQNEIGRELFSYCFASSSKLDVSYIDANMDVYRCTYSVGTEGFRVGNLNSNNSIVPWQSIDIFNDSECLKCFAIGYCSGGCKLSTTVNREQVCREEKNTIKSFITEFKSHALRLSQANGYDK